MELTVDLPSAQATRAWGGALAGVLRAGDLVILIGELGAGKTTLVQGLAKALQVAGQVASPTFIIARQHPPLADGPWLIHADAYRLESLAELDDLDLDTSLDQAITVVEWGQGVVEALTPNWLEVKLTRSRGTSQDPDSGGQTVWPSGASDWRVGVARGVGERWSGIELPGLAN